MEYSQYEYDQHLVDPGWSSHETAYLFNLLRDYDLRFVVAADRYEYKGPRGNDPVKRRTVEEMKDRYYTICRRLVRTRTASDPQVQQQLIVQYSFDKSEFSVVWVVADGRPRDQAQAVCVRAVPPYRRRDR